MNNPMQDKEIIEPDNPLKDMADALNNDFTKSDLIKEQQDLIELLTTENKKLQEENEILRTEKPHQFYKDMILRRDKENKKLEEKVELFRRAVKASLSISDLWMPANLSEEHRNEGNALSNMKSKFEELTQKETK